jgi:hypothetical protein
MINFLTFATVMCSDFTDPRCLCCQYNLMFLRWRNIKISLGKSSVYPTALMEPQLLQSCSVSPSVGGQSNYKKFFECQ